MFCFPLSYNLLHFFPFPPTASSVTHLRLTCLCRFSMSPKVYMILTFENWSLVTSWLTMSPGSTWHLYVNSLLTGDKSSVRDGPDFPHRDRAWLTSPVNVVSFFVDGRFGMTSAKNRLIGHSLREQHWQEAVLPLQCTCYMHEWTRVDDLTEGKMFCKLSRVQRNK